MSRGRKGSHRAASAHEQHPTAGLVWSLVALGRRAEAKAAYREMLEFEARPQNHINPETLAIAAFGLGDRDGALAWFEKSVDMHSDGALWMVRMYPELRQLLADPRYQRLLDRMHLPHEPIRSDQRANEGPGRHRIARRLTDPALLLRPRHPVAILGRLP